MALEFIDLGLGTCHVDYLRGWDLQQQINAEVAAGSRPSAVLLLEHEAVYTAGRRTEPEELPTDGSRVIDVDRGGKITWHGPGQLVAYPIVRLPETVRVVDYVRRLEEAMIRTFGEFGLTTGRVDGRTGVWLPADDRRPERKIAAIGVRVSCGVTMHGLAMNITNPLDVFDTIVPCGISDAGVTNLVAETGQAPCLLEVADILRGQLDDLLSWHPYQKSPDAGAPVVKSPNAISYGLPTLTADRDAAKASSADARPTGS
jgi:lipoyl(octanoyl) transferase